MAAIHHDPTDRLLGIYDNGRDKCKLSGTLLEMGCNPRANKGHASDLEDYSFAERIATLLEDLLGVHRQDPKLALEALRGLNRQRVIRELARRIAAVEPQQRALAVEAMIWLDVEQTLEYVLPRLSDIDSNVRGTVCYWFEQIGDRRAIEPLIQVLLDDPDVNVRTQAAKALVASQDSRAIPVLTLVRTHDFELDIHGHSVSYIAEMVLRDLGA